jgi:hypothetical protein
MAAKKQEVIIDVYTSEEGELIYFLGDFDEKDCPADVCTDSGFFVTEEALDEFLEENKRKIRIVRDYRAE